MTVDFRVVRESYDGRARYAIYLGMGFIKHCYNFIEVNTILQNYVDNGYRITMVLEEDYQKSTF
jgi:hypothetical protein